MFDAGHETEPCTEGGSRCVLCLREFPNDVWGACPGVPQFQWESWPDGLFTAKQLSQERLKPGEKRGAIWYPGASDRSGWLWLYRKEEATPKPALSEKRMAALAKMQAAQKAARTCRLCGNLVGRKCDLWRGIYCRECDVRIWARETLDRLPVFVDVETSGLEWDDEILQIGIVDAHGTVLLDTYVKPVHPIDEEGGAFYVNGITNAMVEAAPRFSEIHPHLCQLLTDRVIVAYNADFDSSMLDSNCEQHCLPRLPDVPWVCAMEAFAQYYGEERRRGGYRWQKLGVACATLGVADLPEHQGASDAFATLQLLRALAMPLENRG